KELATALDKLATSATNKRSVSEKKDDSKLAQVSARLKPKHWWQRVLFAAIVIGLYASIGRPILHTTTYAVAGSINLYQGASAAKSLSFEQAEEKFENSQLHFAKA